MLEKDKGKCEDDRYSAGPESHVHILGQENRGAGVGGVGTDRDLMCFSVSFDNDICKGPDPLEHLQKSDG